MTRGPESDDASFEDWYVAAHPKVLAALVAYCGNTGEAAEATDEAFARAYTKWATVQRADSPTGWTFVVGRNIARRRTWRTGVERARIRRISNSAVPKPPDHVEVIADQHLITDLLRPLSRRQRTAVILHYLLDLSQDDVARLMGVSRSTVATTLLDARRAVQGVSTTPRSPNHGSISPVGSNAPPEGDTHG
jgi:RNA polymerase sigma-70 factor (ECF subfamily)